MINTQKLSTTILLVLLLKVIQAQEHINTSGRQLFDHNWKFSLNKTASDVYSATYNDKQWRSLNLPHDWSIEGKTDPKNPSGNDGGYFPTGTAWYRKKFIVPAGLKGKKIAIYFEGVYMNAQVYINGKSLGNRPYGYSAFSYDLTPFLNVGKENVIAVKVDNSQQKNCRWYSGSGVYRHVWLLVNDPIHIDQWGTTIITPEVAKEKASVLIKTKLKNETSRTQKLTLISTISDKAGSDRIEVEIPANSSREVSQTLVVHNPNLWSPENPYLYHLTSTVLNGTKQTDRKVSSFGVRSLAFSTSAGFQLNGKHVVLNGGCVHHDNGFLGAAAYDRAEIKKVEWLKAAGFNAIRTSHNPPSETFLHACDSLGLLVMDESFDGWRTKKNTHDYAKYFDEWWKADIESMVLRDRNHPSIFMWSIGNEIIERKEPQAVETAKMLASYVRKLDPTRPVTSAMTTWDKDWEIFDPLFAAHDIGGYNYQLHHAPADHKRVPSRIILQTESYPKDAFANWKLVQENKYILGDFVWTALDYLGESSIGRYFYPGEPTGQHWEKEFYPWHGAYCGDIDLTGWRKPISHYRGLLYNESKKLYMAVREPNPAAGKITETMWAVWPTWESWNWPGFEGKEIEVEVYSRYPKVRLYLNDKLFGEKVTGSEQEFKATFAVPYSAGVLKAVGLQQDGKEVESRILKTAGESARIKLTTDREHIQATGQDLAYITVEVVDKDGNVQPNAENQLSFSLKGPGVIAAVGNANLKDTDPYVGNSRKAWKGRALVIIKSTTKHGEIVLEVNSPGLTGSDIRLDSRGGK